MDFEEGQSLPWKWKQEETVNQMADFINPLFKESIDNKDTNNKFQNE